MKINERWEESNANIQSEEGILKRQIRSIQPKGHFGDIKENESFRQFNYRPEEKVYKEFMLYAIFCSQTYMTTLCRDTGIHSGVNASYSVPRHIKCRFLRLADCR